MFICSYILIYKINKLTIFCCKLIFEASLNLIQFIGPTIVGNRYKNISIYAFYPTLGPIINAWIHKLNMPQNCGASNIQISRVIKFQSPLYLSGYFPRVVVTVNCIPTYLGHCFMKFKATIMVTNTIRGR